MAAHSEFISVDLKSSAVHAIEFLKRVRRIKSLKNPEVLKVASYRYEKFWIPLLNKFSKDVTNDLDYLPPVDVHWIW